MRILVVEDEAKTAGALQRGLQEEGYAVDVARDGLEGQDRGLAEPYDLFILDLMLPGQDGLTLCRHLREADVQAPILLLTARGGIRDQVAGLDSGADDFVAKPFVFEALLARVRALLRRRNVPLVPVLRVADLALDAVTRKARRGAREIPLSSKEFSLLEYLLRHAGRVLTRTVLFEHVWGDMEAASNIVDVYIGYLRQKIDHGPGPRLIHTVRGVGYVIREE